MQRQKIQINPDARPLAQTQPLPASPFQPKPRPAPEPQPHSRPTPAPQAASQPLQQPIQLPASTAAFEALLKIEAEVRAAGNVDELCYLIANETRRLTRSRQIFVAEKNARGKPKIVMVSSLGAPDSQSELALMIEAIIVLLERAALSAKDDCATLDLVPGSRTGLPQSYPFSELLWLPFKKRNGEAFAGMLLAREWPWTPDDLVVAKRLSSAYAHAWRELTSVPRYGKVRGKWRNVLRAAALVLVMAMFVPVSLTALAPAEVVAASPFVIAAPVEGVIEEVLVEPSTPVKKGQVLARFSDTILRNRAETAEREVIVAGAQLKKASQSAFDDPRGRHELGIAEAELALKKAERDFAEELLQKSVLKAPRDGIAVYADRKELTGKPVAAGERIMEIAAPDDVELRVDLAVEDAMALEERSPVKVFLDIEPLSPRWARVVRSDFRAKLADHGTMTFKTTAKFDKDERSPPRLGLRGTGQVYGPRVPLGIYLFRRPLSALRQSLGL